jgi:DNA-binding HxlR family transcriptional regulator
MDVEDGARGYGQYCPIVRAVEVLGERWSVLIVRDLLLGTTRFNDLARGLPGLSRSLLSRRLRQLEMAGIVVKRDGEYLLAPAGRDLEPIVFGLGAWGARWAFGPPRREELDPALLLWWAHSRIDAAILPERRVVLAFVLSDPSFRAWLVVDDAGTSVCRADPGFEVDAWLTTDVATLAEVWLGRLPILDALRTGDLVITGDREVVDALPRALLLSEIAGVVADAEAELARLAAAEGADDRS